MSFVDTIAAVRFSPEKMQKINLFETEQMFCDVYCLEPGQAQKPHTHADATKLYYVIEGTGEFVIGEETRTLGRGQLVWSAPGEVHGVRNPTTDRLVLLVAMAPNPNVSK
jgi:quercetin dioxygenase-like cupin family protein